MGVNKAILLGNVGKDPQIRHLESGTPVCNFSMATNRFYKDKNGERQQVTDWHNIVLWGKLAEIANEYVSKGKQLYIEGRIQTRQYTNKENQVKYITEVVGNTMELLSRSGGSPTGDAYAPDNLKEGNKGNVAQENGSQESQESTAGQEPEENDDLPF